MTYPMKVKSRLWVELSFDDGDGLADISVGGEAPNAHTDRCIGLCPRQAHSLQHVRYTGLGRFTC